MVKCSKVLQCSDGTNNKVSNIIKRHIDNRKLLLICILLLSHSLIFFRFFFYKYLYICILYSCLILKFICFYWKRLCILMVFYVFSYRCLCIHTRTVVYVFLDAATLTEVFPCFFLSCKANVRV